MGTIRCTVSNCEYWKEGNNCIAPSILVAAKDMSVMNAEHHGNDAEKLGSAPIGRAEDCYCVTFEKE